MTSEIKGDITTIYDKIQKDTAQSLKKHSDSIKSPDRTIKAFMGVCGTQGSVILEYVPVYYSNGLPSHV